MNAKKGIIDRIRSLQGERSARNFAQAVGIKPTTYQSILDRGSPSVENLVKIVKETGVDLHWLATGEALGGGAMSAGDLIHIPRYSVEASAGHGVMVLAEEIVDHFSVSREILDRIGVPVAKLGVIQARGDSMVPLVNEGDYLIISFAIDRRYVDAGGIFIVSYDGGLFVKRLRTAKGGVIQVISENQSYPLEEFTAEEADELLKVHAKVVWKLGPLRS